MDRGAKVLIVDDEEIHRTLVRAWLESAGYEVVSHDGARGIATVLFRERPDIVVLDIVMPGLSGDAVARLLSKTWQSFQIGIVFYSVRRPARAGLGAEVPVLGTIRKTASGRRFLSRFERLLRGPEGSPSSEPAKGKGGVVNRRRRPLRRRAARGRRTTQSARRGRASRHAR